MHLVFAQTDLRDFYENEIGRWWIGIDIFLRRTTALATIPSSKKNSATNYIEQNRSGFS